MRKILTIIIMTGSVIINTIHAQVAPLMTTTWNQGCYYNTDCPTISGGACGKAYTGCNATALAQIMKYYAHPATAWGGTYTNTGTPVQTVNYDIATYNWSVMPNSLSSANTEVAKIMYHAGVAVDMQYSATVSNSSFNSQALNKFFKYSLSSKNVLKLFYTNTDWENLLKDELNNGRVVFVQSPTHFYVIDGYQISPSLKFHCNFGWGGLYDGYYDIHNVIVLSTNYTPNNATIGIKPLLNIETSPDTVIVSSNTSFVNYEISSLSSWTVSSNQGWCISALTSGTAGYYSYTNGATAAITTNSSYSPRYASITVTDGSNSATVVVKQNGITPFLSVTPNNLTYSAAGSGQNVNISSDSNWVATTSDAWLTISPNSGIASASITITASANGLTSRTGNVVISRGSLQQSITVFQAASGSFWCVPAMTTSGSNGITNVTLNTINRTSANNEGYINTGIRTTLKIDSAYNIAVTFTGSNAPAIWIDWNIDGDFSDANEAVMPGAGTWYPSFTGTKTLTVTVPAFAIEGVTCMRVYDKNMGTGPVSGPCSTTDVGGDIEDYDITILNHHHITTSPTSLSYLNSGGLQNISVDCDSIWIANTSASWLTISPTNGTSNGTVGVTASVNTSLTSRNDVVTFTRGSKIKTVAINQDPADTVLTASTANINFLNTGGINLFNITSNVSYTITSDQTWIVPDVNSGSENLAVNMTVSNNPTNVIRTGTITVSSGTYSQVVTITQDSTSTVLTASPLILNYTESGGTQSVTITTPSSWNATISDTWFNINQNSGTGDFTLNVICDTNSLSTLRTGSVTISNGVVTNVIVINQDGSCAITTSINSSVICYGDSIFLQGNYRTTAGTYYDTLTSVNGCDSIINTNLTVLPANTFIQSSTVCTGQSITVGSNTYTTNGTYTDVLISVVSGCDSTVTTNLTVLPANTFTQSLTVCAGQSVTVGTNTYTATGTYTDVLATSAGCDSIVSTNLTVNAAVDTATSMSGTILTANAAGATYQWIDCNNANAPIAGATNQTYTATASSNYAVIVTQNSCSDTSSCVLVNVTSAKEIISAKSVSVYPNPSNGQFKIELELNSKAQIVICNTLGETIYKVQAQQGKQEVNISDFAKGIYMLKVFNNEQQQYVRIVKQ
ncbi:MAG: C10 family peptidase [Bacteroidetes bacterium]|nr:C10 family peptidase [Bacteroidota bacterium]